MKKVFLFMLVLVSISFLFGKEMFVVNANSQTLGKVDLTSFTANNNFSQIGMYGNDIKIYDDKIYVVNSGDNEIQVINVNTGENIAIIELEDSANPWSIIFYEDFAYVTGMMTNKLYKIDLSNSQVSDSMEIGIGPEAMIIVNDKLYVTLTGVQYPNYSIGKVALIDLNNFTKITEIEVGTNPQGIIYINNQFLHIMCTGNYNDIKGSVFIVDVNTGQVIHTISFISSFLTTIQPGIDDLVYVGDAFGSGLLSYNIESYDIVNDASNPAFAGGSHLIYDESYYYVLNPGDWVGSSKFQIYDYSKQLVDEINLGIGASAMVMNQINTSLVDTVVPQLKEINAYPNPFNDQINFELTNNEKSLNEKRTIEIFNIRGQKINTLKGNKVQWDGKDYNSKTVPAGVYFARMLNDHNNYKTKKILKIK
jgi:YVTN family beta-propeller protein